MTIYSVNNIVEKCLLKYHLPVQLCQFMVDASSLTHLNINQYSKMLSELYQPL